MLEESKPWPENNEVPEELENELQSNFDSRRVLFARPLLANKAARTQRDFLKLKPFRLFSRFNEILAEVKRPFKILFLCISCWTFRFAWRTQPMKFVVEPADFFPLEL